MLQIDVIVSSQIGTAMNELRHVQRCPWEWESQLNLVLTYEVGGDI